MSESASLELQRTVTGLRRAYAAAACSCALVDEDGTSLTFTVADGAGADAIVGVSLPVTRGIVGWVALSGEPMAVSDVLQDTRFARDIAESTNYVPRTILAAPIITDGEVIGVIEVLDPTEQGAHAGHDLAVIGLVATQAGALLRRNRVSVGDDDLGRLLAAVRSSDPRTQGLAAGLLRQVLDFEGTA